MTRWGKLNLCALTLWLGAGVGAAERVATAATRDEPAAPSGLELIGEQLDFRVRWRTVPAGAARFEVERVGRERLRIRLTVRTSPLVDVFYRVREVYASTAFGADLRAIRYEKSGREGKRSRQEEVRYFRDPPTARSTRNGEAGAPIPTPSVVHDPLAALYAFRLRSPTQGTVEVAVSDGRRSVQGEVAILGREEIETPAGRFQTLKVEPRIDGVGGVFRRSPGARVFLWVTDDEWRRPVRLESEVAVGAFTAELVAGRHGDWSVGDPDALTLDGVPVPGAVAPEAD